MLRLVGVLLLVLALSGCGAANSALWSFADESIIQPVSYLTYVNHQFQLNVDFEQALPLMGFDRASEAGFTGEGVPVLIIDFFGQRDSWGSEHGWAVLETLMAVAPHAEYWRLDLDQIMADIQRDLNEPFDPVLRALYQALRFWSSAGQGVINMSFGYIETSGLCTSGNKYHASIHSTIKRLWNNNINLVASAGNGGKFFPMYPACMPQVMAVGSIYDEDVEFAEWAENEATGFSGCTDTEVHTGDITCFSNRGEIYAVGAFAEGYEHYQGQQPFTGTSLASPLAAGAIALLREAGLSAQGARKHLSDTATRTQHGSVVYRVLNVAAALAGQAPVPLQTHE